MEFDIINLDKYVKSRGIKEVTSSKIFDSNNDLDPNGLGSAEIFGEPGSLDKNRETNVGYIDLGDKFMHPSVYRVIKSIPGGNKIIQVVRGDANAYFNQKKELVLTTEEKGPNGEKVGSGANFLYKNFENWDFLNKRYKTKSMIRSDKIQMLKLLTKDDMFLSKIIVIPPYYRDIDRVSNTKNELNTYYVSIINLASNIKLQKSMLMVHHVTEAHKKLQDLLNERDEIVTKTFCGSKGFIQSYVVGKNIDYAARLVISAAEINVEKESDLDVTYSHAAVPLYAIVKCFAPFIVYGVKQLIKNYLAGSEIVHVYDKETKTIKRTLLTIDYEQYFSSEYIYKQIEIFHESINHRFDDVTIPTDDGMVPIVFVLDNEKEEIMNSITDADSMKKAIDNDGHPITWLELFYMAAFNTVKDKSILITRYPYEDNNSMFPSKMIIEPCTNPSKKHNYHFKRTINNIEYPKYPNISRLKLLEDYDTVFKESLRMFPIYLNQLKGDFDGDHVSIIGIFTNEGNEEATNHINSNGNVIDLNLGTMKEIGLIGQQTLFNLTYKSPEQQGV